MWLLPNLYQPSSALPINKHKQYIWFVTKKGKIVTPQWSHCFIQRWKIRCSAPAFSLASLCRLAAYTSSTATGRSTVHLGGQCQRPIGAPWTIDLDVVSMTFFGMQFFCAFVNGGGIPSSYEMLILRIVYFMDNPKNHMDDLGWYPHFWTHPRICICNCFYIYIYYTHIFTYNVCLYQELVNDRLVGACWFALVFRLARILGTLRVRTRLDLLTRDLSAVVLEA